MGSFPPWCQTTRVCCRFVDTFQANWHWFEPNSRVLVPQFGAAACVQGCARLPMAICALLQHHLLVPVQHYQDDHHCVEPSYSVAQAWMLIRRFYGLLRPKLATPGGDKYPLPSQVYRLLGTKVDLIASPREIQVLPSRIDSICCELDQILSSKKLGKGHAAEIFGKLSFSAGQLFGRFGRMHLALSLIHI